MAREPVRDVLPIAVVEDAQDARLRPASAFSRASTRSTRGARRPSCRSARAPSTRGREKAVPRRRRDQRAPRAAARCLRGGTRGGVVRASVGSLRARDVTDVGHEIDEGRERAAALALARVPDFDDAVVIADASSVRCSSPRRVRRFTADLCAFVSRANGAPVATSVARMAQSEPPERRTAAVDERQRAARRRPGWHEIVRDRAHGRGRVVVPYSTFFWGGGEGDEATWGGEGQDGREVGTSDARAAALRAPTPSSRSRRDEGFSDRAHRS